MPGFVILRKMADMVAFESLVLNKLDVIGLVTHELFHRRLYTGKQMQEVIQCGTSNVIVPAM